MIINILWRPNAKCGAYTFGGEIFKETQLTKLWKYGTVMKGRVRDIEKETVRP